MATPNIVNVSTINGNTTTHNVSTVATAIVSNATSSNKIYKINTLVITNTQSASANISVFLNRSAVDTSFIRNIVVPPASSFTAIDKTTSIYLLESDSLRLSASSNNVLDAICSFEEIS